MRYRNKALAVSLLVISGISVFSEGVMASCGGFDTCYGSGALRNLTSGTGNTGIGFLSLYTNTTGNYNSASGVQTLFYNTIGSYNSATGHFALFANTTGSYNTAAGFEALKSNTTGSNNVANGRGTLYANTTGQNNTADGPFALYSNISGSSNIAVGESAGYYTSGSHNIVIGHHGVASESNTIRIGRSDLQTNTFLAGVHGVNVTGGAAVYVTSAGHLGTVASSRRYKEDIQPMGDISERLMDLQPVTFHYKQADEAGNKPIQYGLIAEDVESVMPELVVRNADGSAETVAYHVLPSLLLNEYQKQHQKLQDTEVKLSALEAELDQMKQAMERLLAALPQATKEASLK
jgi:hypothetical protein